MKPWLNVSEAAEYAGLSRDTIYTACERGELRHAHVGGRRKILLSPNGSTRGSSGTRRTFKADGLEAGRRSRHERRSARSAHRGRSRRAPAHHATSHLRNMIERRQLPAVIRVRRRVLLRADDLLDWLNQKRAPSPEE